MSDTPELDRMIAINTTGDNRIISEFLEWAEHNGYCLVKTVVMQVTTDEDAGTHEDVSVEVYASIEDALAHYFNIDMDKVHAEREQVYAGLNIEKET